MTKNKKNINKKRRKTTPIEVVMVFVSLDLILLGVLIAKFVLYYRV